MTDEKDMSVNTDGTLAATTKERVLKIIEEALERIKERGSLPPTNTIESHLIGSQMAYLFSNHNNRDMITYHVKNLARVFDMPGFHRIIVADAVAYEADDKQDFIKDITMQLLADPNKIIDMVTEITPTQPCPMIQFKINPTSKGTTFAEVLKDIT